MYNFDVELPTTVADAVKALGREEAQPLSGGQTLIPTLKARLAAPSVLVSLHGIAEMKGVCKNDAGQICIAPDYALIHKSKKMEFLKSAVAEIEKSDFSIENDNYVQIINKRNTKRLIHLLDKDKIYYGGVYDLEKRYIAPTLMTEISFEDEIMEEEIFGPILPIIEYDDLDEVITQIKARPKPLACYVFSNSKSVTNKILSQISFGGGAVNDALMHILNNNLPFGGVGESGIGAYHGKFGFRTFSHYKSILDKSTVFSARSVRAHIFRRFFSTKEVQVD